MKKRTTRFLALLLAALLLLGTKPVPTAFAVDDLGSLPPVSEDTGEETPPPEEIPESLLPDGAEDEETAQPEVITGMEDAEDEDSGIMPLSFGFGGYGWDSYGLGYNPICSDPSKLAWIETFTSNNEYSIHPWRSSGNIGLDGSPQNISVNDYSDVKAAAGTAYGWFYPIRIDCETGFGNGQRWIAMDGIPGWIGARTAGTNQYSDFRFWDVNSYTQQASPPGTKWTTIPNDVAQAMYAAIQSGPSGKGNDEVNHGDPAVCAIQVILINLELGFWTVDGSNGYVMGSSGLKSSSKDVNQEVVDILSYVDTYMYYYKHGTYADGATIAAANSAKKTLASNAGCTVHTLDVAPHVNTVTGKLTSQGTRTVYSHGGSSNQDQALVYLAAFELEWGPVGYPIGLKKVSADSSVTEGNGCYSLAGAVYGLYSDPGCNSLLERLTTDGSGNAKSKQMYEAGTYYIKEISASPGYLLDSTIYSVRLDDSGNVSLI